MALWCGERGNKHIASKHLVGNKLSWDNIQNPQELGRNTTYPLGAIVLAEHKEDTS